MLPAHMQAWVVREERHGNPLNAMRMETVPVPRPGPREVVIEVKAAGVNYNHIWVCLGKPVSLSSLHDDPIHIGGSDAAGIIVAVGKGVKDWQPGDEVVTHPNQSCGQCAACNGYDPLSCRNQKAWGFETSHGSFAQYAKVRAQQLLRKPKHLNWLEASCYGLKLYTAYRMLILKADIKPNDRVLIWGAAGGLGSYAIQLCLAVHAIPICVVSSEAKAAYCRSLGAKLCIDRSQISYSDLAGMRRFRASLRELAGGYDPDVVFEHVGAATFPASVFVARRMGRVVICGATSGYQVSFDARYLWTYQKQILGSHGCNLHDARRASFLIESGIIQPTLTKVYDFKDAALAHEDVMVGHKTMGSLAIKVS